MKQKAIFLFFLAMLLCVSATPALAAEPPPYRVKVDSVNQLTYVYAKNESGEYDLMDVWATSTGKPSTPTVHGEFTLKPLSYGGSGEWYLFASWPCWVNYVTSIKGNYCFHSPPMNVRYDYTKTPMSSINEMLSAKSHGCVRLFPRQAAFMWYNMGGCKVEVYKGEVSEEASTLRARLYLEVPKSAANYPDPVITEYTTYWYTYHNDTVEKIASLSGRTPEELQALNPSFDFSQPITPGAAIKIKGELPEPEPETPPEMTTGLYVKSAQR